MAKVKVGQTVRLTGKVSFEDTGIEMQRRSSRDFPNLPMVGSLPYMWIAI